MSIATLQLQLRSAASLDGGVAKDLIKFATTVLPVATAVVFVVLTARQAADLTWKLFPQDGAEVSGAIMGGQAAAPSAAAGEQNSPLQEAAKVSGYHLFGAVNATQSKPQQVEAASAPETRLSLTLFGVFVGDSPQMGSAIIGKGAEQNFYKVGQKIMAGVTLQEVYNDRVVILREGKSEVLKFPKTESAEVSTVEPTPASPPTVPDANASLKDYQQALKAEPLKIFDYMTFKPVRRGQMFKGYRVLPQKDRQLYDKLGLLPTDLVKGVNGIYLNSDSDAMNILGELKDARQIELKIFRNGREETLSFSLD